MVKLVASSVFSFLIACVAAFSSPSSAQVCVQPDLASLSRQAGEVAGLPSDYSLDPKLLKTASLLSSDSAHRWRWVSVSWEGPRDGVVFIFDCTGKRLGLSRIGYLRSLSAGPSLPGLGQTVEAVFLKGQGTGVSEYSVALLAFDRDIVQTVWQHEAEDDVFAPGLSDVESNYLKTYRWHFANAGLTIQVVGTHSAWAPDDEHRAKKVSKKAFIPEIYCWSATKSQYVVCHGE